MFGNASSTQDLFDKSDVEELAFAPEPEEPEHELHDPTPAVVDVFVRTRLNVPCRHVPHVTYGYCRLCHSDGTCEELWEYCCPADAVAMGLDLASPSSFANHVNSRTHRKRLAASLAHDVSHVCRSHQRGW